MQKNIFYLTVILLSMVLLGFYSGDNFYKKDYLFYKEKLSDSSDCVEDSLEAIKIAERELLKAFGKIVLDEKPFIAVLKDSVWYVHGTMQEPTPEQLKEIEEEGLFYVGTGGTAQIQINKKTCEIFKIFHEE